MKINTLTKMQAKIQYISLKDNGFKIDNSLDNKYTKLRDELIKEYWIIKENSKDSKYAIDLNFGLRLYKEINKFAENNYQVLSDINFWIFLSIRVIPECVFDRFGDSEERFYKHTKRVWLNQIYWYIHLSWQSSEEETLDILRYNSTDSIVQIVERSGKGYNIELYRKIMEELSSHSSNKTFLLRRVMLLNTLYATNIEPDLYFKGLDGYVKMLFSEATN